MPPSRLGTIYQAGLTTEVQPRPAPPAPPRQGPGLGTALLVGGIAWYLWDEYKSRRRSARVQYGFDREVSSARYFARRGASAELSPGSRGAYDVEAHWTRTSWLVQIKASRDGDPRRPGPSERARLVKAAARRRAVPVVGLVRNGRTTYEHAVTGQRLRAPRR